MHRNLHLMRIAIIGSGISGRGRLAGRVALTVAGCWRFGRSPERRREAVRPAHEADASA